MRFCLSIPIWILRIKTRPLLGNVAMAFFAERRGRLALLAYSKISVLSAAIRGVGGVDGLPVQTSYTVGQNSSGSQT